MVKRIYRKGINFLKIKRDKLSHNIDELMNNPVKARKAKFPTRYIHIGYPKAASTAIQKGYLGRHNQLLHLGSGNRFKKDFWDDHGYMDADINRVVEIDLRYKNSFSYDKSAVKTIFDRYFEKAELDKNIHAIGLSNENFSFNWHGGIDIEEKVKRLHDIFGSGTRIVVTLRQQKALIESLYKESIRFGYSGSFHDYLDFMWQYKDRNFTYEFCFLNVIDLYSKYFGKDNVKIVFFEDLKIDKQGFLKAFSEAIGIDYYEFSFDKEYNTQLDLRELAIKLDLNRRYPHTFEKGRYDVIDSHRFIPYYTDELKMEVPNEVYYDYFSRSSFNRLSKQLKKKIEIAPISIDWECNSGKELLNLYERTNGEFLKRFSEFDDKFNDFSYLKLKR